jgi:hypothetical protein
MDSPHFTNSPQPVLTPLELTPIGITQFEVSPNGVADFDGGEILHPVNLSNLFNAVTN